MAARGARERLWIWLEQKIILSDVVRPSFEANRDLKSQEGARCQTSKTRVRARLDIRTERLADTPYVASRQGARSASEMQSCWLDKGARGVQELIGIRQAHDACNCKLKTYLLACVLNALTHN